MITSALIKLLLFFIKGIDLFIAFIIFKFYGKMENLNEFIDLIIAVSKKKTSHVHVVGSSKHD